MESVEIRLSVPRSEYDIIEKMYNKTYSNHKEFGFQQWMAICLGAKARELGEEFDWRKEAERGEEAANAAAG